MIKMRSVICMEDWPWVTIVEKLSKTPSHSQMSDLFVNSALDMRYCGTSDPKTAILEKCNERSLSGKTSDRCEARHCVFHSAGQSQCQGS